MNKPKQPKIIFDPGIKPSVLETIGENPTYHWKPQPGAKATPPPIQDLKSKPNPIYTQPASTMSTTNHQPSAPADDPFDPLLSLESQYHLEGRTLGLAEGAASGRIEGRVFGLEKSFEKFLELGKLGGRSAVWNARLPSDLSAPPPSSSPSLSSETPQSDGPLEVGKEAGSGVLGVLPGAGSERLVRHVRRLAELTNEDDVSKENSEEGVQDFDDRLREARAKAVLVERLVGEGNGGGGAAAGGTTAVKRAGVKANAEQAKGKSDEMEDFVGLPRGVQK